MSAPRATEPLANAELAATVMRRQPVAAEKFPVTFQFTTGG